MIARWSGQGRSPALELAGEWDPAAGGAALAAWASDAAAGRGLTLVLRELDGLDGQAVALLTTRIREHLRGGGALELVAPPQLLAHTLYKSGTLDHPALRLREPRQEEPWAG